MTEFPITDRTLWVVYRHGREAMATVRSYNSGRELRISVGGHTVFRRLLTASEDEDRISADFLGTFFGEGWTPDSLSR